MLYRSERYIYSKIVREDGQPGNWYRNQTTKIIIFKMIIGPYYVIGYEVNHKLIISYTSQSNLIRVFFFFFPPSFLKYFIGFCFWYFRSGRAARFKNNVLIKYLIPEMIHPEKECLQLNHIRWVKKNSGKILRGKGKRK